ncbi:MAG: YebC/PmpR family DNA-binding transcriptional regulator, partial [Patescibacteria group bacterium]
NMPKDTIDRAIERAKTTSGHLEAFMYEGFGPGGIAIIVEGVTNNRARTATSVKHLFDTHGGTLAGPGAVRYLFERVVGQKLIYRPLARLAVSPQVATQVSELVNQLRDTGDVTDVATNL